MRAFDLATLAAAVVFAALAVYCGCAFLAERSGQWLVAGAACAFVSGYSLDTARVVGRRRDRTEDES